MILIATKIFLNSDSILQSINLEDFGIKPANSVHDRDASLDPTLSFQ